MAKYSVDCPEESVAERRKRLRNNPFTRGVPAGMPVLESTPPTAQELTE